MCVYIYIMHNDKMQFVLSVDFAREIRTYTSIDTNIKLNIGSNVYK